MSKGFVQVRGSWKLRSIFTVWCSIISISWLQHEHDISSDTLFLLSFCPQASKGRSSFWSTLDISQLSSALYKPAEKNLPGEDYRLQNLSTYRFLSFTDRWDIKGFDKSMWFGELLVQCITFIVEYFWVSVFWVCGSLMFSRMLHVDFM